MTPAQVELRRQGVGASEAYRACLLDAELWAIKTGRMPPLESDAFLRLGNAIEPYIVDEYWRQYGMPGVKLTVKPNTLKIGRQIAHLDALVTPPKKPPIVVQAKWRGHRDGWGARGSSDVPDEVFVQTQQEMFLAEAVSAHVPVLFLRPPIEVFVVAFNEEMAKTITEGVERFWEYVKTDTPVPIDPAADGSLAAVRKVYTSIRGDRVRATADLEHWRSVFHDATAKWNRYATVADSAKAHLLLAMENAGEMEFEDGAILRRKLVKVSGYTVDPREHIEARFLKAKE